MTKGLVLLTACLALVAGQGCAPGRLGKTFDELVTRELISSACENSVPFTFSVSGENGKRVYQADFEVGAEEPGIFYYCKVTVAAAGVLPERGEYEMAKREWKRSRAKEKQMRTEADLQELGLSDVGFEQSMFPDIGKRAMGWFALGPGGGAGGILFTTSDGRFDVDVEGSNKLKEGIEHPGLDYEELARRLSDLYDKS